MPGAPPCCRARHPRRPYTLDYLAQEWKHKPVGVVSYGGVSGGTRGVAALDPVLTTVGLVKTSHSVEIDYVGKQIADGVFTPTRVLHGTTNEVTHMQAVLSEVFLPLHGHLLAWLDDLLDGHFGGSSGALCDG